MHSPLSPAYVSRLGRLLRAFLVVGLAGFVSAQSPDGSDSSAVTVTRLDQFWSLSPTDRQIAQPIDIEFEVLFYDPEWQVLHVRADSKVDYVAVTEILRIRAGDRVRVTGVTHPYPYTLSIGEANWEVSNNSRFEGEAIELGSIVHQQWLNRLVTVRGLVESQELLDGKHLEMRLIAGGQQVAVWVMLSVEQPVPLFHDTIVELTGVYAPKFDNNGEIKRLEIFCEGPDRIKEIAPLQQFSEFDIPSTQIDQIRDESDEEQLILVEGHRVGPMDSGIFWLRDRTGQIKVMSGQRRSPDANEVI